MMSITDVVLAIFPYIVSFPSVARLACKDVQTLLLKTLTKNDKTEVGLKFSGTVHINVPLLAREVMAIASSKLTKLPTLLHLTVPDCTEEELVAFAVSAFNASATLVTPSGI